MSDIVERLRDPKVYIPGEELLHEAADELTRLRAEVERLKAALEEVMEWSKPYDRVHIIARAALGDTHE